MTALVIVQMTARNVFALGLPGAGEVARYTGLVAAARSPVFLPVGSLWPVTAARRCGTRTACTTRSGPRLRDEAAV